MEDRGGAGSAPPSIELLHSFGRWLSEWRSVRGAATQCQRGFFTALAARMTAERGLVEEDASLHTSCCEQARMTAEHWLAEWDEQPFRIAATPPRTIGKMAHTLASASYCDWWVVPDGQS